MPYCPVCKYEYTEGIAKCPDCEAELVAELPPEPKPRIMDEEMVPVFTAKDEVEARIVRGILQEAGIAVWEKADIVKLVHPVIVGPLAEEVLAVPASRVEEARRLIEEALEAGEDIESEDDRQQTGPQEGPSS